MIERAKDTINVKLTKQVLKRKPLAFALAGALGLGIAGAALAPHAPFALAQTPTAQDTLLTPYGRAPVTFADLAEKVRHAVVSIQVKNGNKEMVARRGIPPEFNMPDLPDDHPLNEFFKRFRKDLPGEGPRRRPSLAQGSGFIISADGYVVTNDHVVGKANEISVTMDNGDKFDAELVGSDQRTDLALLKIKSDKKFSFVEFSDKAARVGDWVLAVGNPFGLGGTVTAGIVSAHNRDIGSGPYDYLQIDAAVNRGNSGGPAFSLDGKVIGVNTAIFSPSGGNVGIAFAVPAELARQVVAQLKSDGKVSRGWLGVTIQSVTDDIAASLGLDKPEGALVTKLAEGGPAAKSDLEVGDLIVSVDGEAIGDSRDLARKIAGYSPDHRTKIKIIRDGKERNISVALGTFPTGKQLAALESGESIPGKNEQLEDLGLALAPAAAQSGPGSKGVVIMEIDPDSKAAEKGLKVGDVILEVAGFEVNRPTDVAEGVRKARSKGRTAVHMLVRSGDNQRFIAIPLKKV
jgi:serine protease Do